MSSHDALPFRPHFLLRGGHLQTVATALLRPPKISFPSHPTSVPLADGDALMLHDSIPESWQPGSPSLMIVHGLCGSHRASYMLRLSAAFLARGVRCFRLDMRGCGAAVDLATRVNHAGRSADILAALEEVAERTQSGPLWIVGISLGGNQLLKMLGEIGNGRLTPTPLTKQRINAAIAVAPPIDLQRCSRNMQRLTMRPYDRYFVRSLFTSIPQRVQSSAAFAALDLRSQPKTLWDLDNRLTAPLSGFASATDYYDQSSSLHQLGDNPYSTLVLAAKDDPIVPATCFHNVTWPANTVCDLAAGGGHVGFLASGTQRYWMDTRILQWFSRPHAPSRFALSGTGGHA